MSVTREEYVQATKRANKAHFIVQTVDSVEFAAMLGSDVNPRWFVRLMESAGKYLFGTSLLLFWAKLGISIYRFIKTPNKNLNEKTSLAWDVLHVGLTSTAIIGALAAAPLFFVATPALFITSAILDTLKNMGLTAWNAFKRVQLYFHFKNKDDSISKLKYAALKKQFNAKIKAHGKASFIGTLMVAAIGTIFLFPHIGLGAISATAVIGKFTVAGLAGVSAAAALTLPLIFSGLKKLGQKIAQGAKKVVRFFKPQRDETLVAEERPLLNPVAERQAPIVPTNDRINNEIELTRVLDQKTHGFDAGSKHSEFRETIIDHIDNEELAKNALNRWIEEKVEKLKNEMNSRNGVAGIFAKRQFKKREQKLIALVWAKQLLNQDAITNSVNNSPFDTYHQYIRPEIIIKLASKGLPETLNALKGFVDINLPEVHTSFLSTSDTDNLINALQLYEAKFKRPAVETNTRLSI